jgi:hypothetical protein
MHARVGAPGAHERHGRIGDAAERTLGDRLYGSDRGLRLPARVGAAVVFDADGNSGHALRAAYAEGAEIFSPEAIR